MRSPYASHCLSPHPPQPVDSSLVGCATLDVLQSTATTTATPGPVQESRKLRPASLMEELTTTAKERRFKQYRTPPKGN